MRDFNQNFDRQKRCAKFRVSFDRLENEKGQVIREIHQQRERVRLARGRVSIAENDLSNLIANGRDVANGVGSLVINAARQNRAGAAGDITVIALGISRAKAKQRTEIARLKRELDKQERVLSGKQNKQAGIQKQIDDVVDLMRENDCLG